MALLSKLFNRSNTDEHRSKNDLGRQKQTDLSNPSAIETAIAERAQSIRLEQCLKIPFTDFAMLGSAFAQMLPSLRTIAQTVTVDGMGYIPINNLAGESLKLFRKNTPGIYAGSFKSALTGKSTFVEWVKASPQSVTTSSVMPVDPTALMMAAVLINIEKKLDTIQETQMAILSFLEQDKQAEQQANLRFLTDILSGYMFNWDNPQFLQNHHVKALDIKQASDKNIDFFQQRIAEEIKKLPSIYLDQAVKGAITALDKLFAEYRMAIYLFAFSSFLEMLLLGNFQQEYLNTVASRVEKHNEQYRIHVTECRTMIKQLSGESVEAKILAGLGNATKSLGKLIASSPLLSQGQVDEWLQDSGDKMLTGNNEKTARMTALFSSSEKIGSEPFVDSIKNISMISNQTTDLLFDGEALYIAVA